jgi:hypothetical protein
VSRVLFLDVDGVLNHRGVFTPGAGTAILCPKAVERLKRVVSETGAAVVLSSTWRLGRVPNEHLSKLKACGVMDKAHEDWRTIEMPHDFTTSRLIFSRRGDEIAEWLARHPEVTEYAIVDDDSDMLPEQSARFVQTSFEDGLTDRHADALISLFSRPTASGAEDTSDETETLTRVANTVGRVVIVDTIMFYIIIGAAFAGFFGFMFYLASKT